MKGQDSPNVIGGQAGPPQVKAYKRDKSEIRNAVRRAGRGEKIGLA